MSDATNILTALIAIALLPYLPCCTGTGMLHMHCIAYKRVLLSIVLSLFPLSISTTVISGKQEGVQVHLLCLLYRQIHGIVSLAVASG